MQSYIVLHISSDTSFEKSNIFQVRKQAMEAFNEIYAEMESIINYNSDEDIDNILVRNESGETLIFATVKPE